MRTRDMMRAPNPPGYLEWKLEFPCPICGKKTLLERFDRDRTLGYRCRNCGWTADVIQSTKSQGQIEHELSVACPRCGTMKIVSKYDDGIIEFLCRNCGWRGASSGPNNRAP